MSAKVAPDVVAAIMTYNRRDSLRRCLQAIGAQTTAPAHVLVIDNASTDGTDAMLSVEFPGAEVHRTSENLGCAGAMHEALRLVIAGLWKYVWFFDDDAIPDTRCLEILLREMRDLECERSIGFLRPMVRDPNSGQVWGAGLSMGSLLRAEVVRRVGLPQAELFIELSDHAYNERIRTAGYEILRVPSVLAEHPIQRPWGALGRPARETRGKRVKPWRLYYVVRNRVYFSLYVHRSPGELLHTLLMAVRLMLISRPFGRGQSYLLRGIFDGFARRLGRRVEPGY